MVPSLSTPSLQLPGSGLCPDGRNRNLWPLLYFFRRVCCAWTKPKYLVVGGLLFGTQRPHIIVILPQSP